MRIRGVLPVLFVTAVACSSFSGETNDEDAGAGGDASVALDGTGSSDSDVDSDASKPESSIPDGPTGPTPLACAGATCAAGQKCCMSASGHSCQKSCNANAWAFECLGPSDCATGFCCWNTSAPVGFCTTTCTGYTICRNTGDCPTSTPCVAVPCASTEIKFSVCPQGASGIADYPSAPSCNYL